MAFTLAVTRNGSHYCHFAWLDGLSMASVDSLHSTLKVVTRPLDTNHKKAAFKTMKTSAHESNLWVSCNLKESMLIAT